jgi:hypothetical protein
MEHSLTREVKHWDFWKDSSIVTSFCWCTYRRLFKDNPESYLKHCNAKTWTSSMQWIWHRLQSLVQNTKLCDQRLNRHRAMHHQDMLHYPQGWCPTNGFRVRWSWTLSTKYRNRSVRTTLPSQYFTRHYRFSNCGVRWSFFWAISNSVGEMRFAQLIVIIEKGWL